MASVPNDFPDPYLTAGLPYPSVLSKPTSGLQPAKLSERFVCKNLAINVTSLDWFLMEIMAFSTVL
jgi:hypothetical protein